MARRIHKSSKKNNHKKNNQKKNNQKKNNQTSGGSTGGSTSGGSTAGSGPSRGKAAAANAKNVRLGMGPGKYKRTSAGRTLSRRAGRAPVRLAINQRRGQAFTLNNGIQAEEGMLTRLGSTGSTLFGSMMTNMDWKQAGIGTLHATAAGAVAGGGMAALQGDDIWEGAKSGAFKGAMAGAGYQGLKAATFVKPSGKGGLKEFGDNLKQIGTGMRDTYSLFSPKGQNRLYNEGVSNQLTRIVQAKQLSRSTETLFGLNK